jgi:hypothetical protein
MSDMRDDLKSTGEAVDADADMVKRLEAEKTALDPADPRVPALSERIERLSTGLKSKAGAQRDISEQIQESTD